VPFVHSNIQSQNDTDLKFLVWMACRRETLSSQVQSSSHIWHRWRELNLRP